LVASVILLEEDDTVADFVVSILRSEGHAVHICGNLTDLLVRLTAGADLVISGAGLESPPQKVLSAVRTTRPGTPILVTTTFVEPLEERLLLEMGADAVLHKPFDLPTFLGLVDALASGRTRRRPRRQVHPPSGTGARLTPTL
jgi:DNA-binding response OmpR family regulator